MLYEVITQIQQVFRGKGGERFFARTKLLGKEAQVVKKGCRILITPIDQIPEKRSAIRDEKVSHQGGLAGASGSADPYFSGRQHK